MFATRLLSLFTQRHDADVGHWTMDLGLELVRNL